MCLVGPPSTIATDCTSSVRGERAALLEPAWMLYPGSSTAPARARKRVGRLLLASLAAVARNCTDMRRGIHCLSTTLVFCIRNNAHWLAETSLRLLITNEKLGRCIRVAHCPSKHAFVHGSAHFDHLRFTAATCDGVLSRDLSWTFSVSFSCALGGGAGDMWAQPHLARDYVERRTRWPSRRTS